MNRKARILVVDDDLSIRCAISDLLRFYGFDVCNAANGIEALRLITDIPPDLVVSDIIMPEVNGYKFYHRVRSHSEWLWIPFIFLTAKEEAGDVRYGRELGVDDYIKKPFEPEDLLAAVLGKLARFKQLAQRRKKTGCPDPNPNGREAGGMREVQPLGYTTLARGNVCGHLSDPFVIAGIGL